MPPSDSQSDFFAQALLKELPSLASLDAMFLAQDYSAKVGFDFKNIDIVVGKVQEELREVLEAYEHRDSDPEHFAEELGDCFFVLVNLCRHAGLNPEELAKQNTHKYLLRCKFIEDTLNAQGKHWRDLSIDKIYALWKSAKVNGL